MLIKRSFSSVLTNEQKQQEKQEKQSAEGDGAGHQLIAGVVFPACSFHSDDA